LIKLKRKIFKGAQISPIHEKRSVHILREGTNKHERDSKIPVPKLLKDRDDKMQPLQGGSCEIHLQQLRFPGAKLKWQVL